MTTEYLESISALLDGEADDLELGRLLRASAEDPELVRAWARYHGTRAVLRGEAATVLDGNFAARVLEAVRPEAAVSGLDATGEAIGTDAAGADAAGADAAGADAIETNATGAQGTAAARQAGSRQPGAVSEPAAAGVAPAAPPRPLDHPRSPAAGRRFSLLVTRLFGTQPWPQLLAQGAITAAVAVAVLVVWQLDRQPRDGRDGMVGQGAVTVTDGAPSTAARVLTTAPQPAVTGEAFTAEVAAGVHAYLERVYGSDYMRGKSLPAEAEGRHLRESPLYRLVSEIRADSLPDVLSSGAGGGAAPGTAAPSEEPEESAAGN